VRPTQVFVSDQARTSSGGIDKISPTIGLNGNAARALIRFGVAWEIPNVDRAIRGLLR